MYDEIINTFTTFGCTLRFFFICISKQKVNVFINIDVNKIMLDTISHGHLRALTSLKWCKKSSREYVGLSNKSLHFSYSY